MSLNREQPMRPFLDELADAFEAYEVPDGSIGTDELADGAVTGPKIADGAVDMDKLADDVLIPQPTDAQVTSAVNAALAAHPEWTTTVQPNSIGDDKLVQTGGIIDAVMRLDKKSYGIDDNQPPLELFERGSIANGVNDTWRSGVRARSKSIMHYESPTLISVTSGAYFVTYYDSDGNFESQGSWNNSAAVPTYIPAGKGFRLVITSDLNAGADRTDALDDILGICVFCVDAAKPCVKNIYDMRFEHGSLNEGADDAWLAGARVRSIGVVKLPVTVDIYMKTGYYGVHLLNEDESWSSTVGWLQTTKHRIPAGQKFRLTLANDPNASAITDVASIVNNLVVEVVNECFTFSSSPNIIYQCRNVDDATIPPESKWAVKAAAANQYDRIRFTVRVTTDGYYFCCHDNLINTYARNPDGSAIVGNVYANDKTLAELNAYDWGIKYGTQYAGATVPLLDDVLKYAAMYNLGVTWHAASQAVQTDSALAEQFAMLDKYGLTDNLIVITTNGNEIAVMRKFITHNQRVSAYCLAADDWYRADNIEALKSLQTPYNKIYVQDAPWGSETSPEFLTMAKTNNFLLYDSTAMSQTALLTENKFSRGYSLIEANNVRMIKNTVRTWADSLIV